MSVQIAPNVRWISECLDMGDRHVHAAVYLVDADDGHILIDSGSFHDRDRIRSAVDEATAGEGIDALILSHADFPHSANASAFQAAWADVDLIASTGRPELQGLEGATKCPIGGTMEVLGRTIEFVDPPLVDRQHTVWLYDEPSQVLVTADAFGDYHTASECELTSGEMADGISFENVYEFHRETLPWLRFVEPQRIRPAIRSILDDREVDVIAPIHGNPIVGDDLDAYLDTLIEAIGAIAADYEPPEIRDPSGLSTAS